MTATARNSGIYCAITVQTKHRERERFKRQKLQRQRERGSLKPEMTKHQNPPLNTAFIPHTL